jgi:hypothetical protein
MTVTIKTDPAATLLDQAAELHMLLLPDSAISRLSRGYARSFYRFVARSRTETVSRRRNKCKAASVLAMGEFAVLTHRFVALGQQA